jgi:mRNA interferase RelE/StbE
MLKVSLTKDARKFLDDLPAKQFRQIVLKIFDLMKDPRPHDSCPLKGFDYLRADCGEYRIVYRHDAECLYVVLVGKRNDDDVYKRLGR